MRLALHQPDQAGNVGAILRTAAAFGVRCVVLDQACADPWSPKALRAGMGGHFALQVQETGAAREAVMLPAAPRAHANSNGGMDG